MSATTTEELRRRLGCVVGYADNPSLVEDGSGVEQLERALELVIDTIEKREVDGSVIVSKNWLCNQLSDVLELHVDDEDEVFGDDEDDEEVAS